VILIGLIGLLIGFAIGLHAGVAWASRWIDHRWYCGRQHPAALPCEPNRGWTETWKRTEERLNRAEELETEAKRLRRSS